MANASMPRQDIPENDKNEKWFKSHLEFAEHLINNGSAHVSKMNRLYDSYNGKTEADSIKYLVSTYGKRNRSKYIPYRLSKTKLDILVGEFLKTNLNATVKTINSAAVTAKMQRYELMLGAMHAKSALDKLGSVGVDVMEGAKIPDKDDPTAFQQMSFKDKNESIMQIMLKEFIKELALLRKFSNNVQDCTITSRVYGRIAINEMNGDMDYEVIDPRDGIFVEFERDPFLEKTPIMGAVQRMPVHKILTTYKLSPEERNKLDVIRQNPSEYVNNESYRGRYSYQNGEFCADVIHIEWKSVRPKYSKVTPLTERQKFVRDSEDGSYKTSIRPDEYEKNRDEYIKRMEKGDIKEIITEWEEDMYEALQIGHDIQPKHYQRRAPFIQKDEDTGKILGFSYYGMVFNKVDGDTISLKEICDTFDNVFDVLMYQILKEINKAKGKVIIYDRAGLPRKTTVKNVLYNAFNDSFIDYDSSAAGNMAGKDLSMNQIFREIDLGVSNSFPYLLQMKNEVISMLDLITGIYPSRQGTAAASATVTNTMQSVENSRTITEPMFYYLTKHFERIMLGIVEKGKLVWGLYQPNKARTILGDEKYNFLQLTKDIAFASYNVELVNPRWEQQIMDRMRQMAEYSLNAKEIRALDVLDLELQETLADKKAMLKKAWADINAARNESAKMQMQADAENQQRSLATQVELNREQREDQQSAVIDQIREKGRVDIIVNSNKAKDEAILNRSSESNQLDE